MTSFPIPFSARPHLTNSRVAFSSALTVVALATVGIGVELPWVTLFRGLTTVPGFGLEGGPLAGAAVGAAALLTIAIRHGGGRVLRPAVALMAAFVAVDALFVSARIREFAAHPGAAAALTQPEAGTGPIVTALGGGLLAVAAIAAPVVQDGLGRRWAWVGLSTLLFVSGWIHLLLVPAHLEEDRLLGIGFIAAGLAQVGLGAAAAFRPDSLVAFGAIAINAALVAVYAYAVLIGLPFGGGHDQVGLVVGAGEPIDLAGVASKTAEIVGILLAFLLLPASSGHGSLAQEGPEVG